MTDEKEILTPSEHIELKRKGTSDFLRVPASWRKSVQGLQGKLEFNATVKRDEHGVLILEFRKVQQNGQTH